MWRLFAVLDIDVQCWLKIFISNKRNTSGSIQIAFCGQWKYTEYPSILKGKFTYFTWSTNEVFICWMYLVPGLHVGDEVNDTVGVTHFIIIPWEEIGLIVRFSF